MRTFYIILFALQSLCSIAQDDIYDNPEPVVNRVRSVSSNNSSSYTDDYNPNFDYRYSRNLRRVYNPYYMMPTTAYMNMFNYPGFNSFYTFNPWNGGFNSWNDPWNGGFNSWGVGFNSWNDPFYNPYNPWGNNIGFGYSPFCNFNNFNSWNAWNSPFNNSWNNPFINNSWGGNRPGSNQGWSNPSPPRQVYQNRLPRPTRNQNAGNFGTFSNPSRPNAPAPVVTPPPSNNGRGFFNTAPSNSNSNNSNSNSNGNTQRNSSGGASFGSGTSTPAPVNNNSGGRSGGGRLGRF